VIDGNAFIFSIVGNPVAQVRLPQVMEAVFRELKVNGVCVPMLVDHEGLKAVVQALRTVRNFRGVTVTIPHKPAIGAMLERLSERAQTAGAVNLVRRDPDGKLSGDIVDGAGFVRGLELRGHSVKGASVWIVGVGGAGSAIAGALAQAGVARLFLRDADPERPRAMIERLKRTYPQLQVEAGAGAPAAPDFAVNATPLGLDPGHPLPFDPARLPRSTVVCDIVMKPRETALLQAATARGMRVHHGSHMMDAQVPMYLDFLGIPYPDEKTVLEICSGA
jgi:shikimate dehydrogenase